VSSSRFYADLPVITDFRDVARPESFQRLPDDWHVAMSDVRDSTVAIQSGRYKNVNTVGAATITAVLNAAGGIDIPYVFEGDGSTLCVPAELLDDARAALLQTRELARRSFDLDLRVATLAAAQIREAGFQLWVARYRVSENYVQAVFAGGGMAYAERTMKDPRTSGAYAVQPGSIAPRGRFDGLECRWQDVPSPRGETVSLMVRASTRDPEGAAAVYRGVMAKLAEVYGDDDACHPISAANLSIALDARQLGNEVGARAGELDRLGRWKYLMRIRAVMLLGWFLMKFGIRTELTDWSRYKETLVRNADVRKFNDVYRQILAGTAAQRELLEAWLESRFRRGELVYGLHVTNRALMTCLVFDYAGRHLHFIDGADGGLFLAAKAFKQRLAALRPA
jgi:hypothetical protein